MEIGSENPREVVHEIFPYLRQYKDGTVERLVGTGFVPPGFDPKTGVISNDVVIIPPPGAGRCPITPINARIYRPSSTANAEDPDTNKLFPQPLPHPHPLVVYLHGGAFLVATSAEPKYHHFLNALSASAGAVVLSVDYRLAPEHPLPAAFDDAWAAIQWVAQQKSNSNNSTTLNDGSTSTAEDLVNRRTVDFSRVFLAGDSAGATMAHHVGCRIKEMDPGLGFAGFKGIVHIHPYFWGKEPLGSEGLDSRKEVVDTWWEFVCPSDKGCDDPLINPFVDGAPRIEALGCQRLFVCVAEKDIFRDRGIAYYEFLMERKWQGKGELFETKGEDHAFHIFDVGCAKSMELIARFAEFINHE